MRFFDREKSFSKIPEPRGITLLILYASYKIFLERPPEKIASELTDEQREAELMKKKGNEQFVEKNLNVALDFYQKAVELGWSQSFVHLFIHFIIKFLCLDPINPVFYSNSAAVYLDLKKYPKEQGSMDRRLLLKLFYILKQMYKRVR